MSATQPEGRAGAGGPRGYSGTTEAERRVQFRAGEETALWLREQAGRDPQVRSASTLAAMWLAELPGILADEVATIELPLPWALAITQASGAPVPGGGLRAAVAAGFAAARGGPVPYEENSCAAMYGISEQEVLRWLGGLRRGQLHALADAVSRWAAAPGGGLPATTAGFAAVGLRAEGGTAGA